MTSAIAAAEPVLAPMPAKPTLLDVMRLRLHVPPGPGLLVGPAPHGAQSALQAQRAGLDEEIVFACLIHDLGMGVQRADHGWWGAQLVEPYVSEKVTWAIRYHQALRFYPDAEVGYEYPEIYVKLFGPDYQPPEYMQAAYREARRHRWYMAARGITIYDDYSFDRQKPLDLEPFVDIVGRHFRQPKEGLGNDSSAVAHMWRTIIEPNKKL